MVQGITKKGYVQSFYNDAEVVIPTRVRKEIDQICSSGIRVDNRTNSNSDLSALFKRYKWRSEVEHARDLGHMDFKKDNIGVEVQLRQGTNLLYDVLKFELDYQDKLLTGGVIITYDQKVSIVGKSGQDASIQKLSDFVTVFVDSAVINFRVPLWVIGLKRMSLAG